MKSLTVLIPAYKSKKFLISHIKKISKKIKIIIVDNSYDAELKTLLEKRYSNTKVVLEKNIGFGRAINSGSRYVKTKFFFVINPDTIIYKDTLKKILKIGERIKIFGAISPDYIENKNKKNKKEFEEKETITAGAMLFKTEIFKKLMGFDNNIFLYYEDNDFFRKCRLRKYKLYIARNCYHHHKKKDSSSAIYKNREEREYFRLIAGWHGQWSKFYYTKKYNGYFYSLYKSIPRLLILIIQLILSVFINFKRTKYLYFRIEGLFSSIIGLPAFKRSKFDKSN